MARKLVVEIVGDSKSLERAFARSERSAKSFNRQMSSLAGSAGVGGVFGVGKGGAIAAGSAAAVLGLRSVIKASSEAQVILGQTSVAVRDAGLSWERTGTQIEAAATRISRASAFDDEAVLQSFQVFVRGQKDVARSLQLSELAADVARGRYTDLESATQLVNKAAMGQIGALRRAGIQIDKNATSTEALTALYRAYGGAAKQYSDNAAGASERLHVSLENVEETLGKGLLPGVTAFAGQLSAAADEAERLAGALQKMKLPSWLGGSSSGNFIGSHIVDLLSPFGGFKMIQEMIDRARGVKRRGSIDPAVNPNAAGPIPPPGFGGGLGGIYTPSKLKSPAGPAGVSAEQRNQWFDAMVGRELVDVQDIATVKGRIGRLKEISAQLTARVAVTKDITRKLTLEDQVKEIARTIRGDQADIAAKIAADAQEAAATLAEANRAAAEESLGWLDFAVERAQSTKGIRDDVKALRGREAFLKEQIAREGRTLDLVRELWRTRDKIRDLNKSKGGDTDPMAGLMQVGSARLARILAAGTGLGAAGTRRLGQNIAGAELRPLTIPVMLEGREIGRATRKDDARTGSRTSRQTSGRRG